MQSEKKKCDKIILDEKRSNEICNPNIYLLSMCTDVLLKVYDIVETSVIIKLCRITK